MSSTTARISLPSLRDLGLPVPTRPYAPVYQNGCPLRPLRMHRPRQLSVSSSNTAESDSSPEPESEIEVERTPSLSPPASPGHYSANSSFTTTIMPRTPSPPPVSRSQRRRVRSRVEASSGRQTRSFKLVLTTLPKADAILFVPAPERNGCSPTLHPDIPSISNFARQQRCARYPSIASDAQSSKRQRALLLVGPTMQHLRTPLGLARLQAEIRRGARIHPYRMMPEEGPRRSSAPATMLATITRP